MTTNQTDNGAETLPIKPYYPKQGDKVIVNQIGLNAWFDKLFPSHACAVFPVPTEIVSDAFYNNVFLCYAARVSHGAGWQIIPIEFIAPFHEDAPPAIGDSVMFIRDMTNADLLVKGTYSPQEAALIRIPKGRVGQVLDSASNIIEGMSLEVSTDGGFSTWFVKTEWVAKL